MNRHEIRLLQQNKTYPALTISLPTHRTAPDNRQDPIRVKNLVTQATNRLLGEFSKRDIDPLLIRLEQLTESIDYRYTLDGIVLCVGCDFARSFHVPFALKERVVVDTSFFTRDLVFAMNRTPRYWTLVLSEQPTRLFECSRDTFIEIRDGEFPMSHEGPGGEQSLPGGVGVNRSAYRDEQHRQFFRQVDTALKPFMADDPLPLAIVGVDRYLAFFDEVTSYRASIATTLTGSHTNTPPHELGKLVWPLVEVNLVEKRRRAMSEELDTAINERKVVSTIGEVWRLANEGRGSHLLVEEDFHFPGRVDQTRMRLTPADDRGEGDVIEDAVDEVIETVLSKQGKVTLVNNGELEAHQRIALILRY
jgi:hypothetical protein